MVSCSDLQQLKRMAPILADCSELKPKAKMQDPQIESQEKTKMLKEYEQKMGKTGNKRPLSRIPLWYFLHEILEVERCRDLIQWENKTNLVFTIKKPKELAVLWGQIKDKETMTYPKLARGIRYYYGKGVIEKFNGKRFSYKFIVSKKTKAVLSKRKSVPGEVDVSRTNLKTETRRKRSADDISKFLEPNDAKILRRERSNTNTSVESIELPLSNVSSDCDEEDSFSESDWNGLDACISEFLSTSSNPMSSMFEKVTDNNNTTPFMLSRPPPELSNIFCCVDNNSCQQSPTEYPSFMKDLIDDSVDLSLYDNNDDTNLEYQNNSTESTPENTLSYSNLKVFRQKSKSDSEIYSSFNSKDNIYSTFTDDMIDHANTDSSFTDFAFLNAGTDTNNPSNNYQQDVFTNFILNSQDLSIMPSISLDATSIISSVL